MSSKHGTGNCAFTSLVQAIISNNPERHSSLNKLFSGRTKNRHVTEEMIGEELAPEASLSNNSQDNVQVSPKNINVIRVHHCQKYPKVN